MKTLYISYFGALKHLSHSQVLSYLKELAKEGLDVTLLSFEERLPDAARERAARDRLRQELAAAGIDWRWLRYHKRPSLPATMYDVAVGTLYSGVLILRKRIDVVHARNHVPAVMALVLQRLLGVKLLFDMRGVMAEEYLDAGTWKKGGLPYRLTKWVEAQVFRRADGFVMLTRRIRDDLRAHATALQSNPAAIEVIPCCVDTGRYAQGAREAMRSRLGLQGKTVLVYTGSLGGVYRAEEMVRFFAEARRLRESLHFLIVTQSPYALIREPLEHMGLPKESYTLATASASEIPDYLAAADFGIHFNQTGYSMRAAFPTKLGEYLASGVPILCNTGIGDIDELVQSEKVGVILDSFDPVAYQQAFMQMMHLLAGGEETRRRCRQAAEKHLSLHGVGRLGYVRAYEHLGFVPRAASARERLTSVKADGG